MNARPPRPSACSRELRWSSTAERRRSNTGNRAVLTPPPQSTGRGSPHDPARFVRTAPDGNRMVQRGRRRKDQQTIEIHELTPVQAVKLRHSIGGIVVAG